tara:strand:+ start:525 stop:896 length:372 start_codon:yes stop_codon:yes gene_type:complete
MKIEELDKWCGPKGIDWKETDKDYDHGEGFLFHWNNPNNPEDGECCHVIAGVLDTIDPKSLYKLIVNGRDVIHITRVCGYYSRVSNWNKSKVGELKDRHRGNYAVGQEKKEEQEVVQGGTSKG